MSIPYDLRTLARALGGEISGRDSIVCPGPNHGPKDRSLSVLFSRGAPNGFVVYSHAGNDFAECRDYVGAALGIRGDDRKAPRPRTEASPKLHPEDKRASWLWHRRRPIAGTLAEKYLREARGYSGPLPATLGFLPARNEHAPAMIAAFGMASEPEVGILAIADENVKAVHLTRLAPDGLSRVDKIMVGRDAVGSPIWCAPVNDGLGLVVTEGIEDALSVYDATGLGAWAAGSAGRMSALADAIPSWVECVTVVGDDNDAGRRGSMELARRLKERSVECVLKILD